MSESGRFRPHEDATAFLAQDDVVGRGGGDGTQICRVQVQPAAGAASFDELSGTQAGMLVAHPLVVGHQRCGQFLDDRLALGPGMLQLAVEGRELGVAGRHERPDAGLQLPAPVLDRLEAGRRLLELFHDLQLGVLQITDPAGQVFDLVDEPSQGFRVADAAVVDALLVAQLALFHRSQIRFGLGLRAFEVGHLGLDLGVVLEQLLANGELLSDLCTLGKSGLAMGELGDLGVDLLQNQKFLLVGCCGFDDEPPCRRPYARS